LRAVARGRAQLDTRARLPLLHGVEERAGERRHETKSFARFSQQPLSPTLSPRCAAGEGASFGACIKLRPMWQGRPRSHSKHLAKDAKARRRRRIGDSNNRLRQCRRRIRHIKIRIRHFEKRIRRFNRQAQLFNCRIRLLNCRMRKLKSRTRLLNLPIRLFDS